MTFALPVFSLGGHRAEQARRVSLGVTLRAQLSFGAYLERRAQTPSLTFRDHLRTSGGAIEVSPIAHGTAS